MPRWQTSASLEAEVCPGSIWRLAYSDGTAWPRWNSELKSAERDGELRLGAEATVVFTTGLRLRFRVVEFEQGRLFTDESRKPGARMGHRHLLEPLPGGGCRLENTIYIEGPLAFFWRRVMGPRAARALPHGQRAAVKLAEAGSAPSASG
jgi:hypothetical protein